MCLLFYSLRENFARIHFVIGAGNLDSGVNREGKYRLDMVSKKPSTIQKVPTSFGERNGYSTIPCTTKAMEQREKY